MRTGMSIALAGIFAIVAIAAEPELKCPVAGKAAKKSNAVAYKGKEVYLCCGGCAKKFENDVAKFANKANLQLVQSGQAIEVACPFSGKPLNPETAVTIDGVEVSFCCNGCKGKVEKTEDKVALVFAGFDKGFTTQTECPISGKAIKADKHVDYKGKKVYFCCGGCPSAFEKDPSKYEEKLPQLDGAD